MMIYLKFLLYTIPDFLSQIIGKALAPFLALLVGDDGHLPKCLRWFETDDHDCDGDKAHWERHPGTDPLSTWWRRTRWLFRNTAYNFAIHVLGVQVLPTDDFIVTGNPDASDTNGISGYCHREVYRNGKLICFQIYHIKHYKIGKMKACIRLGMGWKLWGDWHENGGKIAQLQVYFNPVKCMTFEG